MKKTVRKRRIGALTITAMLAALLVILPSSPASAAPTETWLDCSAAGNPFNLPINMDGVADPESVFPGESFDATVFPEVVLTEEWVQGALITAGTIFPDPVTEVDITNIRVRVPVPDGADGDLLEINWSEGVQVVGEVNPDYDPNEPPSADNPPSFATGSFAFEPPEPGEATYTATGPANSDIDFLLGSGTGVEPLRIDLMIGGALPLPITCNSVATEIEDPDSPDPEDPDMIPVTQEPFLTVGIDDPDQPTLTISDVTGQVVTNAARSGNEVSFGGPNWDEGEAVTLELCDTAGESCTSDGLDSVSASVDGDGVLSGTATITGAAAEGPGALKATQAGSGNEDTASLLILGTPTLAGPSSGGLGAPINVTGTNWNPGSTTTLAGFTDGALNQLGDGVQATVGPTGNLNVTLTVVADAEIVVAGEFGLGYPEPGEPGSLSAFYAPFTVLADELVCTPGENCDLNQTVVLDVLPGNFTFAQDGSLVDLGEVQLDGTTQTVNGEINEVTVIDARGSLVGWNVTATLTPFTTDTGSSPNHVMNPQLMTWTPACAIIDGGEIIVDGEVVHEGSTVETGDEIHLHAEDARALCSAPVNASGGTFEGNADLELIVPASIASGNYSATLTLVAI